MNLNLKGSKFSQKIQMPHSFLEQIAEKISCGTLDMTNPAKSSGQVIEFIGRTWIPVGGASQGQHWLDVDLRECVLEKDYQGSPNDPKKRGDAFYTGGRFQFKGKTYVMTSNEITIIPIEE